MHPASDCKVIETVILQSKLPAVETGMTYILYSSLEPKNIVKKDLSIEMFSLPSLFPEDWD